MANNEKKESKENEVPSVIILIIDWFVGFYALNQLFEGSDNPGAAGAWLFFAFIPIMGYFISTIAVITKPDGEDMVSYLLTHIPAWIIIVSSWF